MKTYQIGKSYELDYLNTVEISNRKYLCVTDGETQFTVAPYDFQLDWPDQIPDTLLCYVKDLTLQGKPRFTLDRYAILKNRYPQTGINCPFYITTIVTDANGAITGYRLSDAYGITHFIPARLMSGTFAVSDKLTLYVRDIAHSADNNSKLLLLPEQAATPEPARIAHQRVQPAIDTVDLEEGEKVEFKTSIVYLAATSSPDQEGQGKVIMQTIAGFMNNEGGKLLIGVNDNGEIVGIQNDLDILFPNGTDNIHDKYELAIRKRINSSLGPIPNTKVHINFITAPKSKLEYVMIDVGKAEDPVFVAGTHLFVRAGNMTLHLKDYHIVSFIIKRLGLTGAAQPAPTVIADTAEDPVATAPENLPTDVDVEEVKDKPVQRPEKKHAIQVHNLAEEEKIIGHLYFLPNGACRYITNVQESKPDGIPDFVFRAPVPTSPKNYNFLIFYSNGDTDIINLESALFGSGRNSNKKKEGDINPGWNTSLKILDAFCVKNTQKNANLIAYISKLDGQRFIKLHEMSAIAKQPHVHFGNKGNQMLAKGAELQYVVPVSGDTATKSILSQNALIRPDSYKGLCGTPIDKISGQYIEILKPLMDKFEDVPETVVVPTPQPVPEETTAVDIVIPQQPQAPKALSTFLYILSGQGEVVKTLKAMDGAAVASIPFNYENLMDLCSRRFPELDDDDLTFVKFTCPDENFNKSLTKDIMEYLYSNNYVFLGSGNVSDYKQLPIASVAERFNINEEAVKNLVSNGYFLTEMSQYPLYDAADLAMVV